MLKGLLMCAWKHMRWALFVHNSKPHHQVMRVTRLLARVFLSRCYASSCHCLQWGGGNNTSSSSNIINEHKTKTKTKMELVMSRIDVVHSTVARCPSDLITLSLFIWTAQRQNYYNDFNYNYSHDIRALDYMVPVLQRLTNHYKTLQVILFQLETIGCVIKRATYILLLRILWHAEMHPMVLEAYHLMQVSGFEPNTFARNILMDVLFKIGQPNLALRVFHHTEAPNFFTFNYALCHLSKLNDITHTGYVFRLLLRMGYYPSIPMFEMLLNCFSRMNGLLQVYQVLGLMISLGFELSVNIWTILIHTYCKVGRLDVARNLHLKMAGSGCSPNVVTYTILFKAFMQSGMVTEALDLLKIMLSTDQNPDLILCNVLIDCLSKVGRYQDAVEVFAGLSKQNLKPDSYTFTSLLSTICLSGKFYLLPKFNLLPKLVCGYVDTDLVLCNALLCSFVKAGLPSHAVELYNNMVDKGFTPDNYTFAGLLTGLCASRRIEEAVNVYRGLSMSYPDVDAHIHTVIIGGLVKVRKYNMAADVFRFAVLKKYPLDGVAFGVGIYALLRCGRIQEARAMYDQMKVNGLRPDGHTFNLMIYVFCREKNLQMIKVMLQEMIDFRVELSDRNLLNISKLPCGSETYFSTLNLLSKMRGLGLLSAKVLHSSILNAQTEGEEAKEKVYTNSESEQNLLSYSSSSEDLSDIAAVC
ncbi:hypothetical protein Ahy_A04g021450 isoform C [Arachis hypogaea]|uniref:Pentatricopeptide repeat-containing protein n=2 Tax=Arachis hypogaea TaxID=3818 RepID=A0A445DKF8_ARAHY|nr:hypothetical protein Ahy_A04g021450 isoform A [Arachis hypogaea]RYR63682.1 hypothetical protein Ahy_A04g021450 isoform B [Arachis hypogaea]RYR63683.1 hypothetical protein Ahy_A04g021450 isoform C [Arachis hypogaea]